MTDKKRYVVVYEDGRTVAAGPVWSYIEHKSRPLTDVQFDRTLTAPPAPAHTAEDREPAVDYRGAWDLIVPPIGEFEEAKLRHRVAARDRALADVNKLVGEVEADNLRLRRLLALVIYAKGGQVRVPFEAQLSMPKTGVVITTMGDGADDSVTVGVRYPGAHE